MSSALAVDHLVDGVVDISQSRLWYPAEPTPPMYIPGRFADGLEPLQDGDVRAGVGGPPAVTMSLLRFFEVFTFTLGEGRRPGVEG